VVDRISAAATDPDHLDLGALIKLFDHLDRHKKPPSPIMQLPSVKNYGGIPVF
jgi:hypothetical protein